MSSVPHRAPVDIPKQVTQNQPAGLTHPIASRLDAKQPIKATGGVTKPVVSKISQPTSDLPPMPGVKSAFNVPVESLGQSGKWELSSFFVVILYRSYTHNISTSVEWVCKVENIVFQISAGLVGMFDYCFLCLI